MTHSNHDSSRIENSIEQQRLHRILYLVDRRTMIGLCGSRSSAGLGKLAQIRFVESIEQRSKT
jgi:hypothetical protein